MRHIFRDDTNLQSDDINEYYRVTGLTWKTADGITQPRYDIGAKGENVFVNIGKYSASTAGGASEEREVQVTVQELVDNYINMMKAIKLIAPHSDTVPAQPDRFPLWIDTNKDHQYTAYYDVDTEYTGLVNQKS